MKKFICLLSLLLLIFSCKKKEILMLPFEVTKNIDCNYLFDNDFRWIPGVDVILLGKKTDSIEIVYNVEYHKKGLYDHDMYPKREIDILLSRKLYEKYKDKNWLEVPDSIYYSIWGSKKILKKIYCKNSCVIGRNYDEIVSENEVGNIKKSIDTSMYEIFDVYWSQI